MLLQDRLDALKADFIAGRFPVKPTPEQLAVMERNTAALIASGQADRALKAGDRAPDFELEDSNGNRVSLSELRANGPVVLSFYRGVWCPYCNLELQALQAVLPEISARGARLAAVSPQTQGNSRKSERDNKLQFPILSDPGAKVADAFGIKFALGEDLIALYRSFGNDLARVNENPDWVLPMPARYVIDRDGVIAYAEVNPDYTRRPEPSELLPVLDQLRARSAA